MSEKRKDNKGRILKTEESQRPNGTYAYRYKDIHKKEQRYACKEFTEFSGDCKLTHKFTLFCVQAMQTYADIWRYRKGALILAR